MTFEVASKITRTDEEGTFAFDMPDGWQQGRGAFGGVVLATLLRAIEASEPDAARKTRTVLGDLAGPVVVGKGEIVVTVLRRGGNQSNIRADLVQNGETLAFASAVLSTPRPVGIPDHRPRIEAMPKIEDAMLIPRDAPMKPVFTKHFDMTVKSGIPFAGGKEPATEGWILLAEPPSVVDAPLLIAYLDSYWPAFFAVSPMPRPIATVSFTAEVLCDPSQLDPKAPLFFRARTVADHEGFQLELRELFNPKGELVAANQQTFCVIK